MTYKVRYRLTILIIIVCLVISSKSSCDNVICDCTNSTCNSCLTGDFYYNSSAVNCKLCPPECKTCNPNQQCLACRDMYYLADTSCLQCQKYCKACTSSSTCTQSKNGYILINSVCQKCQVSNVETCQSLMTVKTCLSGYWKNGDSCSPCREFCSFCTSSNNCLQCQPGYMIQVSAGTFCVACPTGCKTCSSTSTCSECFWNWRLINNTCVSINSNCSSIANCQSCEFTNNTIKCILCNYPYFISAINNTCIQGSSILCQYSSGQNSYQCLNQCSSLAYASSTILSSTKNVNQILCLPKLWIENSMIEQIYFHALYYDKYQAYLLPYNPSSMVSCGNEYMYSGLFQGGSNTLKFLYTFKPYYKLTFYIKYQPIFKQLFPSTMGLNLTIKMSDNATNTFSTLYPFSSSQFSSCQQEYLTISSRNIKDQQVTVQFTSQLTSSSQNDSQLSTMFPNGLVGYREILIQVYRCDSKCRVCSNAKYCLQCYGNLFLSSYLCVENCNGLFQFYQPNGDYTNFKSKYCLQECYSGYYSTLHPLKNNTYICLKCPEQCLTCKSNTECLSCQSPYLLFSANFSCISSCPNTHYPSISTSECLPCNAPCKTCVNETKCLSCSIGYFDGQNCVGSCSIGTYSSDSLRQCLSCDPKCSSCQNTATFCTSCTQPYKLLGTSCLQSCPLNTYYPYNNTCLPCKTPCLLCLSQTQCLTCSRGYLLNNSCLTDCPSEYYKDMGNNKCNLCENNCLTCLSASICRTCVNGTFLYNSMCLSQCPIKTYTSASNVCIPCLPPCLTCHNETSCITCSLGYLSQLSPNTCVTQCEDGYYGQSTNQTCMKCSDNCKTCSQQATFCLTCYTGMLFQNNACVNDCSAGYFAFNNEKCRPCSYPCKTCVDISSKCLTCIDPYILISENKCSLQCLSTQYKENGTCLSCQSPCETCTNATSCLSCTKNTTSIKYLFNASCVSSCPKGMYSDSLSLKCKYCVFPCSQCLSSSQCLSCISGYLNVAKKTCEVCSSSYYPDNITKTCQLCSSAIPNCSQCQSSTLCKMCVDDYYLFNNNTCVSMIDCQNTQKYYVNMQLKRCSECILPCENCLNSSYCLTCVNGYLFQGRCPFTCPSGYFANITARQCKPCNSTICRTCSNSPNECTSCFTNSSFSVYFVDNKTCIPPASCQQSYFLDYSLGYGRCLKCTAPCKTCKNASYCLSCTSGVLYSGSCSFSCPNKFYADQFITMGVVICQQCSSSCLQCSQNDTNCISCPVTKLLEDNLCVDKCSSGYYLNQYILQCFKCQSPCLQCQSATYCNSCQDSKKILYYGQCIDQCPEGTYLRNMQCIECPKQCQLCSYSNVTNSPVCDKCALSLFMNSTVYGSCETSCEQNEYGDSQTRKCYPCQVPCNQCYTATKCKSCISGYLIYKGECYKGNQCMTGTYLDPFKPQCLDQCYEPYYGDGLTKLCSLQCLQKMLKIPISTSRICARTCPQGYYVDQYHLCNTCGSDEYNCNDLLTYEIYTRSIFNKLYVKVKFSKQVATSRISEDNITVTISDISVLSSDRRLLLINETKRFLKESSIISGHQKQYTFKITQRTSRALWLQIDTVETLKKVQVKVTFDSYYLLSPTPNERSPSTNLQQLDASILLNRFDQYTTQQQSQGKPYETYSTFLSILLFVVIIISVIGNFLSLFYPLIDYFQILFMIEFVQIDYPPDLNYFLYGFRHAHYLFLPQIFSTSSQNRQEYSQTPGKFGIIVPDADFLSNTGHDFLIIFVCIAIVVVVKLLDFLLSRHIRNNKVSNDPQIRSHVDYAKNEIISENRHQKEHQKHSQTSIEKKIDDQQSIQQQPQISTQNKIQQQILQGKHGRIVKYSKIFLSRLKWNYFNDVCYCLYFYVALFSYSQYYIISQAKFVSSFFAIMGFLFTLALPVFFAYLIYTNQSIIQHEGLSHRVYLPFKTFYYFTIPDSGFSLYQIPIRYVRKLLIAVLLVYCSQFPQFVLGIIMVFSLLNIIMIFIYKPFILTFEIYVQGVIELLFMIVIFSVCLIELEYLDLSTQNKLTISKTVVAFTIILTIVLVVWNLVRFTVEIVKQLCQKDYFENYYKEPEILSTEKSKKDLSFYNEKDNHNNDIHEQSNVRLNQHILQANDKHQISSFGHGSSQQYSGLDIYLKKQHDAPPMLIKCIKKFSDESRSSDDEQKQSEENKEKQTQQRSNDENEKMQHLGFDIIQKGVTNQKDEQKQPSEFISGKQNQKDEMNSGNLEIQSLKSESIKQQKSQNIFQPQQEQQQQKQQKQEIIDQKIENDEDKNIQKTQQPITIYHPRDVKQIFERNRNRDKNKMNTIIQVSDFDIGQDQVGKMPISEEQDDDENNQNESDLGRNNKQQDNQK